MEAQSSLSPAQLELKAGDRVVYLNDPHGPLYTVVRAGETFIMITDNVRTYPKSNCFNVPRGTVAPPEARPRSSGGQAPAAATPRAPGAFPRPTPVPVAVPDYGNPKTAEEFQAAARGLGARADQLAELFEIWHQPAPNGGVRVMRCRNYIRNRIVKAAAAAAVAQMPR